MAQAGSSDPDADARARALKRARDLRDFYQHLVIYLVVNAGLVVVDVLTGDGWWFYWVAIFWGIAVAIQAAIVFGQFGPFRSDWEERKADEILRREQDRNRG